MSREEEKGIRLNRFLASCGVASRRGSEPLIAEGRVTINGEIVLSPGMRVMPGDHVKYDGKLLQQATKLSLLLNKPKGYLCTRSDPEGRKTIYELLSKKFGRLNYVGRLDYQSEGLLILTNSGDLTEALTHPRHHVEKEYEVYLDHMFDRELIPRLLEGFRFEEGHAKAERVSMDSRRKLRVVLCQGYNRQIRRMFSKLGFKVKRLERIRIGSLTDPALSVGKFRVLNSKDLQLASMNPK